MQRAIIIFLIVLLLIGGAAGMMFLRSSSPQPAVASVNETDTPAAVPTPAPLDQQLSTVVVDARVVPARSAGLTFSMNDVPVTDILIDEGETVAQNDPLMRLDSSELQLRVEQAEAALARAKAEYARLEEGATPAQLDQARAQISEARARLQQTVGSITEEDIAAARARLEETRARLARLEAGPRPAAVEAARAALDRATFNLERERSQLSAAKTVAASRLEQAANELRDAQDEYSKIYWEVRDFERRSSNDIDLQERRTQEAAALRAVKQAEEGLEQARVLYEQAQQAERTGLQAAEAQVREARAELDLVLAGPDPDQIAAARAQVADAAANLTGLQGAARAGSVAAANADVANAQARLDSLLEGPLASELARAEAIIAEREVDLKREQLAAERATLLAPMTGTVAEVNVQLGEVPDDDIAAVVIADTSEWQLETANLTDLDVVRIREGDAAVISFFALPNLEMRGTVQQIKPMGQTEDGETIYTAIIALDEQHDRLRWNMVGQVSILTGN